MSDPPWAEGYERALDLMRACASADGFVASPTEIANYRRVWSRDGVILGLAALASGEEDLVAAFARTLRTLAEHQGPHGEIPSNVDTATGRVSYGGTTGRVDAPLWFVVGLGRYWSHTGDESLLRDLIPAVEKARSGRLGVQQPRPDLRASGRRLGRRVPAPRVRSLRPAVVRARAAGAGADAARLLAGIHAANALPRDGEPWSFPEYVHGLTLASAGTRLQGWSAAAAVLGHHALAGTHVFGDPAGGGF